MGRNGRIAVAAIFAVWLGWTAYEVRRADDAPSRDVVREWAVGKYVVAGRDPYSLAKDVLIAEYGEGNPGGAWVSRIPSTVPEARRGDVIPELGPPEATYPPGAIGFLALSLGAIDDPDSVVAVWFLINVGFLLAHVWLLSRMWPTPPLPLQPRGNFWWILLVAILFSPVYTTIDRAQFSLLVLTLMLVVDDPRFSWPWQGLALGVALLKPSVCLPMVLIPLIGGRWKVLATAAAVQAASSLYVAVRIGREPVSMFQDWMAVSRYFLSAGMYTVQEWLLPLSTRISWVVPVVPLLLLAGCAVMLKRHADAPRARLFSLAGVTAVFWTYHGAYDAVFLLPMLLRRMGWSESTPAATLSRRGVLLLAVLSAAYSSHIIGSTAHVWHAYRWMVRFGMIALVVMEYVDLERDARRKAQTEAPVLA